MPCAGFSGERAPEWPPLRHRKVKPVTEKWNRAKLVELSGAFTLSRILISAAELDVFTKLVDEPRTVDELCEAEGWDPRGLRILLDALASQGLLSKSATKAYSVPEDIADMLSARSEESILPMVRHRNAMWTSWSNLTEIVRTGRNPIAMGMDTKSDEEIDSFIGAMHVLGRKMADGIAESLDLSRFTRMLDVGGGAGTYSMAFLKKGPHMSVTLFDLPQVVEIALRRLERDGFLDRVKVVTGDFKTDELPAGHDLVLLSAIIHMNSREGNRDLFEKAYHCLEPGGAILIRDYFLDESRTSPPDGAIFAVNMLAATRGGDSYTFEETREDLESVGFTDIRMIREGTNMDQLVLGIK